MRVNAAGLQFRRQRIVFPSHPFRDESMWFRYPGCAPRVHASG
jgi:hypothetical protein